MHAQCSWVARSKTYIGEVLKRAPIVFVVAMGLWCPLPGSAQSVHLRICNEDADNFPYLVKGGQGLDNQQLNLAAKRSGIVLTQVALPWKRCFKELQEGAVDGVAAASFSEERAVFAQYPMTKNGDLDVSLRLRNDSYSLFRPKDGVAGWDGKRFVQLAVPIGTQLGYSVAGDLRKAGVSVDATYYDAKHLMGQLALGRLQMAAMLTKEGDALLVHPEFAGKIERISPAFVEKPYFVIFSKRFYGQNKKTVEQFWGSVAAVRETTPVESGRKR